MIYGIIEGTGEFGNKEEQATGTTYWMKRGSSEDDTEPDVTYITTTPLNLLWQLYSKNIDVIQFQLLKICLSCGNAST